MDNKKGFAWEKDEAKRILVLNGSPRRNSSSTMRVTNAFLKGVESRRKCDIEIVNIYELNIKPCTGCLSCWGRTDGECVITDDDIPQLKQKILEADVIIDSHPIYFFGMPGTVKQMTDRLLSMLLPYCGEVPVEGKPFHEPRYDMSGKRCLLISSCGFTQTELTYDALLKEYDCIFGTENYQAILCPQGNIYASPHFNERTNVFLEKYADAGIEFAENGVISEETIKALRKPIFDERRYSLLVTNYLNGEKAAGDNGKDPE